MDRETIRENFDGKAWVIAALLLVVMNAVVLVVTVQVPGASGINVHFTYRDRVLRSANIYMAALARSLHAPVIVGIVGLLVDQRKNSRRMGVGSLRPGFCPVRIRRRVSSMLVVAYVIH
jgi:hypothetical protein